MGQGAGVPLCPGLDDADCGNAYRNLTFPDEAYGSSPFYEEKVKE